jgi:signal transduction histidine kinase
MYIDLEAGQRVAGAGYLDGVAPLNPGPVGPLSEAWLRALRDREMVVADVAGDSRLSHEERTALLTLDIGAFVVTLFVKDGRPVAALTVLNEHARRWVKDDLEVIGHVGERIREVDQRDRAEEALRINDRWMRGQNDAFQAAINGATLGVSLGHLTRLVVEETGGAARTGFYMASSDGTRLHPIPVRGGMPDAYACHVDGFPIGADSLACGLAIATGRPVLTRDVFEEALWQPWIHLAKQFDFRACWSFPLYTRDGRPVGSFAMYFAAVRDAGPRDVALGEAVTQAAAIIISRDTEAQERARAEQLLRDSKERESFLLRLSDALRPLADPIAIQEAASRLLGEHLAVARAAYGEMRPAGEIMEVVREWTRPDTASVVGHYQIDTFGTFFTGPLREGRPAIIEDAANDPRISPPTYAATWRVIEVRSAIAYPLVKQGRLVAVLFVHENCPRHWSDADVSLLEEVGERTWAAVERARAEAATADSERQLAVINHQLSEANRRKDEFLAMLGHELRNPLGVIASAVQLIRTRGLKDPILEKALGAAKRQCAYMTRLIEELLDVARITEGKVTLKQEVVGLAHVIDAAVEASRPAIDASAHRLYCSLPTESLSVTGDSVRLVQAVGNLLNNAAKYTPAGGEIHLALERVGHEAVVRVRDTGHGMPPDLLPSVFDLFVQGSRSRDRGQGGLGIGLTLAKRLVEMHGGRIRAESRGVGLGSEFTVTLPLLDELPTREGSNLNEEMVSVPTRRRILVVDDLQDGAEMLRLLLQHEGHDVTVAHGGAEALALAISLRPEFVILDIGMPEIDGYEVARSLREHPDMSSVTLIALTGYGQEGDARRSHASGFDCHLVKPANVEALRRLLG